IATVGHRWLCKDRGGTTAEWRAVRKMRVGDEVRSITQPWGAPSFEDGWFGGLLDGEGSIRAQKRAGAEMVLAQAAGPILDRATTYLKERGYTFRCDADRRPLNDPVHPRWTRRPVF